MDFTKGHIGKSIFLFSIPLILGNIFQQMYTLINSAFVGNYLGTDALAAVGSCYPVVFFITSMILGIGSGGSVVVSHYYGAKQSDNIHTIISTFYIFFILLGLVICSLSIIFADVIFSCLSLENSVRVLAVEYFRIYMIGMFFSVIFHSAISILRGLGDSTTQLYFLIPANILNTILSYIFLGVMHLGVSASALASLISQFLAFVSLFVYLHRTHEYVRLPYKNIRFNKSYLKQIVSIGVPTGIQQSVVSLTQILILWLVVKFGTSATAAYSAAMRIESIALLFVLNISQALTSFTGTNIGASLFQRAKQGFYASLKIMAILSIVTMIVFCGFNTQLMRLFTNDAEVIRIGNQYLLVSGLFWFVYCYQMMYTAFFRGAGRATITMIISIFSLWIVRYPVSYFLSLRYDTIGIWLGAPIAWLVGVLIYLIFFKVNKWQTKSIVKTILVCVLLFNCLTSCTLKAQKDNINTDSSKEIQSLRDNYPQDYFISPLSIPLTLSGTFAELRGSHFHSGADFRTNERCGYNVMAAAEGYVSRIKVQAYGGGKNLYITHPNGYTTVYMHLQSYEGEIGEWVKEYQYKNQCYTFDYVFPKPKIYVKQGQVVALSGESGAVQGPHLHFEIRDTKTEQPINPLLFGLQVLDTIKPYIKSLVVTPLENSFVEAKQESKIIDIIKDTSFQQGDTIECLGNVFFSILAFDPSNGSSVRNGTWKTELFVNKERIFSHQVEKFSFSDYGYVDATINYPLYIRTKERYLTSKQMDNGVLPYNTYTNKGIVEILADSLYEVSWLMTDLNNNSLLYTFYLKGVNYNIDSIRGEENRILETKNEQTKYFAFNTENTFTAKDGSVFVFPKNSLYEDINFTYSVSVGKYSNTHRLHTIYEPVKKKFKLSIKPYKIDNRLKDKYLIVKINSKGGKSSVGGSLKNGFVETTTGDFGAFAVWVDTIAPTIKPLNFRTNKRLKKKQKTLKVRIMDNLSGVKTYNGYLNGEWVLMEFDGKRSTLTYTIDEKLKNGKNNLKIVVTDAKNNKTTSNYTINYHANKK